MRWSLDPRLPTCVAPIRPLPPERRRHQATSAAWRALMVAALVTTPFQVLSAQTDFLNTDAGRPLQLEDALAVEWRAVEVQFAPFSLERHRNNQWQLGLEPELSLGILPRTHLSIGLPIVSLPNTVAPQFELFSAAGSARGAKSALRPAFDVLVDPSLPSAGQINGLAGVHVGLFHQLNVETSLPALAIRGDVLLPVGPFGPSQAIPSLTGIVTRTLSALGPVRVHANATVSFGTDADPNDGRLVAEDVPRWRAGMSMDRAFALQSTLVAIEAVAQRGRLNTDDVLWRAGVGVRHQFSPRLVLDIGAGRQLNGPDAHWSFTLGSAVALGLGRRLL
jgi:hypothetical protein